MAGVAQLYRYPVKSAAGEAVRQLAVTDRGVVGDRLWAVADLDEVLVSLKHPDRGAALLQVSCRYEPESGSTTVDVPGAPGLLAGRPETDQALSKWLDRPVRLTCDASGDHRLRRMWPADPGLVPEWRPDARPGGDAVTEMAGPGLRRSFVDYGAIHIVTASELRRLSEVVGEQVEALRFRPNVVVDGVDRLPAGASLTIGSLLVRIERPTARCVVPAVSPHDGVLNPKIVRTLARFDRRQVADRGVAACFGVYAFTQQPGTIHLGDPVAIR